ncbi:hypothetical protein LCGC14_1352430 [marine sediment metagenome]|uniref:Uncharacterized protein n=1 Tax=marine sediment metagenome TaxID=412755 RepID=A0A0F9NCR0_9ZZZZ
MSKKLTEVQNSLYNEDFIESFTHFALTTYKRFEETEKNNEIEYTEDSAAPTSEESETYIFKVANMFYNILKPLFEVLKEWYASIKEILPSIFDKFVEGILLYSKKQLSISFEQIFKIFQFFGLDEIYPETFDKINAALQWKICQNSWIDMDFLNSYKISLLSNAPIETLNAINDLIVLLKMKERERKNDQQFEDEILKILES